MPEMIEIVAYDPDWPDLFDMLRDAVAEALGDLARSIEHVGSTSVPGLPAKPIIDITAVVRARTDLPEIIERLESIGYRHRGDLGIDDRDAFEPPVASPRHHLYVCPYDSLALANHLAVRDRLRVDPAARRAYAALKRDLATRHSADIDAYVDGKTAFLCSIPA